MFNLKLHGRYVVAINFRIKFCGLGFKGGIAAIKLQHLRYRNCRAIGGCLKLVPLHQPIGPINGQTGESDE